MSNAAIEKIAETLRQLQLGDWEQMPDLELYMDQVITYLRRQLAAFDDGRNGSLITPSIINNYVKAGIVPRPEKKKYGKSQLGALSVACILKGVMPMQSIKMLITRDGRQPDHAFYQAFRQDLHEVLGDEADYLSTLAAGDDLPREQLYKLTLGFAMRANADRFIADQLLELLKTPQDG